VWGDHTSGLRREKNCAAESTAENADFDSPRKEKDQKTASLNVWPFNRLEKSGEIQKVRGGVVYQIGSSVTPNRLQNKGGTIAFTGGQGVETVNGQICEGLARWRWEGELYPLVRVGGGDNLQRVEEIRCLPCRTRMKGLYPPSRKKKKKTTGRMQLGGGRGGFWSGSKRKENQV